MTVGELLDLLGGLPRQARVIIDGREAHGIEGPVRGRLRSGYGCMVFTPNEKGRELGVYFTHLAEVGPEDNLETLRS